MIRLPSLALAHDSAPAAQLGSASVRRADISDAQWNDWRWQLGHMLTTADELARLQQATQQASNKQRPEHLAAE